MKNVTCPVVYIPETTNTSINQKTRRPFIKLDYAIKEARALTRTTIALYEATLWFQRNHDDCYPGYEKLKCRAKINSKTTISLQLKILIKVGLVKKTRRGKKQSNIYKVLRADELTDQVLENLKRPHNRILEEIRQENERARKIRQAKRELRARKFIHPRSQKSASDQTYPHKSEVQLLDFHSKAFQASRYSSNRNNDNSKFEKSEKVRGGGVKSIAEFIPIYLKQTTRTHKIGKFGVKSQQRAGIPTELFTPPYKPPHSVTASSKIGYVVSQISREIGDYKHLFENISQANNIYAVVKRRGVTEDEFIDMMMQIAGEVKEKIGTLVRAGAWFYSVLRDRYNLLEDRNKLRDKLPMQVKCLLS